MTRPTNLRLAAYEYSKSEPTRHPICAACDTVVHCSNHGCVPEVQYAPTRQGNGEFVDVQDEAPATAERVGGWWAKTLVAVWTVLTCAFVVSALWAFANWRTN